MITVFDLRCGTADAKVSREDRQAGRSQTGSEQRDGQAKATPAFLGVYHLKR